MVREPTLDEKLRKCSDSRRKQAHLTTGRKNYIMNSWNNLRKCEEKYFNNNSTHYFNGRKEMKRNKTYHKIRRKLAESRKKNFSHS